MYPLLLSSPPLSRSTAFFDTTSPLSPPAPLFICSATVAFEDRGLVQVTNPKGDADDPPKNFTFDHVFSNDVTQRHIYEVCAAPVVEAALQGFNGTIFAYGQTGAGKSFTMEGEPEPPELRGIIPNSFQHIFDVVALAQQGQQYLIRASYLEIYNEEIRDLLSKDPKNRLELKENMDTGVYVAALARHHMKLILSRWWHICAECIG